MSKIGPQTAKNRHRGLKTGYSRLKNSTFDHKNSTFNKKRRRIKASRSDTAVLLSETTKGVRYSLISSPVFCIHLLLFGFSRLVSIEYFCNLLHFSTIESIIKRYTYPKLSFKYPKNNFFDSISV